MQRRSFLAGLASLLAFPSATKAFVMPENPRHMVHYKGRVLFDAGMHYCPYVPREIGEIRTIQAKRS